MAHARERSREAPQPRREAHLRRLPAVPRRWATARAHRRRALRDAVPQIRSISESLAISTSSSDPGWRSTRSAASSTRLTMSSSRISTWWSLTFCNLSNERMAEVVTPQHVRGAPEIVIEIGSPGTRKRDETIKKGSTNDRVCRSTGSSIQKWTSSASTDAVKRDSVAPSSSRARPTTL
jgi:hypothetical protein